MNYGTVYTITDQIMQNERLVNNTLKQSNQLNVKYASDGQEGISYC
jgi:hypothetical protein